MAEKTIAKKAKKLSTDEALVEVFKVSLDYVDKSDKLYMDFLNNKVKFIMQNIDNKKEEEPLKFLKKAHKKWEMELEALENELADVYSKIGKEVELKQEFYEKLKSN